MTTTKKKWCWGWSFCDFTKATNHRSLIRFLKELGHNLCVLRVFKFEQLIVLISSWIWWILFLKVRFTLFLWIEIYGGILAMNIIVVWVQYVGTYL